MNSNKSFHTWLLPVLLAAAAIWSPTSHAQSDAIDPDAVALLKRSTDYVAALKHFRVDTESSIELVTTDSQKLQFGHHTVISVERPNRMRVERVGEIIQQVFYYDGKTLSVSFPNNGYYAMVAAPATIDATLDLARDKLDVVAPGADFLYTNAYERLSAGLTSARFIGEATVAGVRCEHLAFRNAEVDWQIWIEEGDKPFPRKFVVTSKRMAQSPEFSVVMNKWDTSPKFTDATWAFTPPKGAKKIEWLPASAATK